MISYDLNLYLQWPTSRIVDQRGHFKTSALTKLISKNAPTYLIFEY